MLTKWLLYSLSNRNQKMDPREMNSAMCQPIALLLPSVHLPVSHHHPSSPRPASVSEEIRHFRPQQTFAKTLLTLAGAARLGWERIKELAFSRGRPFSAGCGGRVAQPARLSKQARAEPRTRRHTH